MRSRVSVEAVELNDDETDWTEAGIFIERETADDADLPYQALMLNRDELRAVYDGLRMYFEQGIWNFRTVGA